MAVSARLEFHKQDVIHCSDTKRLNRPYLGS